jgi:hypothetical protein
MCVPGRSVSSPGCLRRSPLLRRSSSPAHCWITRAVSAIRCVMNTPGSIPPAAGPDWRVRYRIDQDSHTVVVLDVSHRSDTYSA